MTLGFIISAVLRYKRLVALVTALLLGAAVLSGLTAAPWYTASATLQVEKPTAGPGSSTKDATEYAGSQVAIVNDDNSSRVVADALDIPSFDIVQKNSQISLAPPAGILIQASNESATMARDIANGLANQFLATEKARLTKVATRELTVTDSKIAAVEKALVEVQTSIQTAATDSERAALNAELPALQAELRALQQEKGGLETLAETADRSTLIRPARVPEESDSTSLPVLIVVGLIAGLSLGAALAVLLALWRRRIVDKTQLEQLTGQPVVNTIAYDASIARSPLAALDNLPVKLEATVDRLAAQLMSGDAAEGTATVIATTSIESGNGATTIALALCNRLTHLGYRVALVDGNHEDLWLSENLAIRDPDAGELSLGTKLSDGSVECLAVISNPMRGLRVISPAEPTGHRSNAPMPQLTDLVALTQVLEPEVIVVDCGVLGASASAVRMCAAANGVAVATSLGNTSVDSAAALPQLLNPEQNNVALVEVASGKGTRRNRARRRRSVERSTSSPGSSAGPRAAAEVESAEQIGATVIQHPAVWDQPTRQVAQSSFAS